VAAVAAVGPAARHVLLAAEAEAAVAAVAPLDVDFHPVNEHDSPPRTSKRARHSAIIIRDGAAFPKAAPRPRMAHGPVRDRPRQRLSGERRPFPGHPNEGPSMNLLLAACLFCTDTGKPDEATRREVAVLIKALDAKDPKARLDAMERLGDLEADAKS